MQRVSETPRMTADCEAADQTSLPLVVGMEVGQVVVAARIAYSRTLPRIRASVQGLGQEGAMRRYHLII